MAKPFKKLREEMEPERRKQNQLRTELALFEMSLAEIRQRRQQVDSNITTDLPLTIPIHEQTGQSEIQQDLLLSTLKQLVTEMGGTLKLVAQFPDEEIVINHFELEPTIPQG